MFQIKPPLYEKIKHFARFPQTGVSLRQMVMFGQKPSNATLFKASQFLHEELPIRLAHRVKELEELPKSLSRMPSIIKVKNWYAQSFQELVEMPAPRISSSMKQSFKRAFQNNNVRALPRSVPNPSLGQPVYNNHIQFPSVPIGHRYYNDINDIQCSPDIITYTEDFVKAIETIKRRHDPVVTTMAQGILEYKEHSKLRTLSPDIQEFLDRFYMSRIGIRMLIGQHSTLYRGPTRDDYVGIICTHTNIQEIAQDAIANARFICEEHYSLFKAPEVQMYCPGDIEFMYVPSHLNHMLFELLKNSLRAVVERYGPDYEDEYPPVKLIIAHGKEDITIKISDEGGGIPRSGIPHVWTYMYTTAQRQSLEPEFNKTEFKAPMAGFGYGLPISRLYARYFGGDLKLISMEGYGTDAYLHLNRLSNSDEPLIM
ncbi:mitochondrial branched-chain alpha-ketoacid dehydrogenase kinase-domain-containing protein [Radiomyces spectabilis]|uniref:mitochondrial branched-chain alpha-ketoacid dehydrogenase kinase-domain-containing protein n=1 Tax=Radiomyces spectabilis TaxID=64574 RepID=UPI00221EDF6A|nr:mitochondrial branched-chain alpha-ketoacid dehydrogenase kinase-domain-containing protein [Radiomyces spectabilis]KAI8376461.1 mitochondrial branched-chain alpha-ketoacid dehydrogenase kinase-domain-containing protein [Radiomyces spectabilis]